MWLKDCDEGATIAVRVSPNAPRDAVDTATGNFLKIRLAAPPVEGRANKALVKFLGKILKVAPSRVHIIRGQSAREKLLLVEGIDAASVKDRLGLW